jgi:hypothetical protein
MDRRPWPRAPRYLVGEDGSIAGPHGRILEPLMGRNGYLQVAVPAPGRRQGRESVHVIVCETFHGPRPDGYQVAHENRIKTDCRARNLSWKTCIDNHADKERHGTLLYGEAHPKARLTENIVRAIRAAAAAGEAQHSIGARYGIHQAHVSLIVRRRIWRRVA